MIEIIRRLETIITSCGVTVDEDQRINIQEIDSLTFISVIIEIENEFCISFPDEYLMIDSLSTLSTLSLIIKQEIDKTKNEQPT